MNIKSFIKELG